MKTEIPPRNVLIAIWLALVALLLGNFVVSRFSLRWAGPAIILAVSFIQMLLVLLFFMRLCQSARIIRVFSVAGFFWLALMFILVFSDYLTRQWH